MKFESPCIGCKKYTQCFMSFAIRSAKCARYMAYAKRLAEYNKIVGLS
jgi:hypothetical protein